MPMLVEATAPCRLDLGGGALSSWPASLRPAGARAVAVALDRRVSCRVEGGAAGLSLESKETLQRLEVEAATELPTVGIAGVVRRTLLRLGLTAGLRIVTQSKVPAAAGLGSDEALAVAVAAALARLAGRERSRDELWELVKPDGESSGDGPSLVDFLAAFHGAIVSGPSDAEGPASGGDQLQVDPARVEECVLLVDPGAPSGPTERPADGTAVMAPGDEQVRAVLVETADTVRRLSQALVAGDYAGIGRCLDEEMAQRRRLGGPKHLPEAIEQIVGLARGHGAGARPCGPGLGGLVLVWAPPGARGPGTREGLVAALKPLGLRTFSARPDLRGLEVQEDEA